MSFDFSYLLKTFWLCVKAIPVTLEITLVSLLLAFIPAIVIALCRIRKVKVLNTICRIFVSFIRGTPIVLQILIVYSIMPSLLFQSFYYLYVILAEHSSLHGVCKGSYFL